MKIGLISDTHDNLPLIRRAFGFLGGLEILLHAGDIVAPFAAKGIVPKEYTLVQFLERTRARIKTVQQPVLVIHAARDKVVSSKSLHYLKGVAVNPKSRFELLQSDRHVLVKGNDAAHVFKLCTDFLRES